MCMKTVSRTLYSIYKYITILLFTLLPRRVCKIYITTMIVSLIYGLRCKSCTDDRELGLKIYHLLHCKLDDDLISLPRYSLDWFWPKSYLESTLSFKLANTDEYIVRSVSDAISNQDLFNMYTSEILDALLSRLPRVFKFKVNIGSQGSSILKELIKLTTKTPL